MIVARSPLTAAGTALAAAGVIAASTVAPVQQVSVPRLSEAAVVLQASIFDIFTFPAWQQSIANEVEFVAIRAAGLADAGVGLVQSAAELPAALATAVQQVFSGNALDALTTIEDWALTAGEATFVPTIAANIEVGQIQLAIQSALLPAQPIALVEVGAGLFTAFDTITRALIIGTQDLAAAIASFNIGAIVQAVVDGVSGFVGALGAGGQAVVDGIVAAQTTLATALAARPVTTLPAAAAPKSAAATLPAVEAPAAARTAPAGEAPEGDAPARTATVSDVPAETPAAVDGGVAADDATAAPAPRRASARAAQRETADASGADAPAKTGKRAARSN